MFIIYNLEQLTRLLSILVHVKSACMKMTMDNQRGWEIIKSGILKAKKGPQFSKTEKACTEKRSSLGHTFSAADYELMF